MSDTNRGRPVGLSTVSTKLTDTQMSILVDMANGARKIVADTKGRVFLFASGECSLDTYGLPALSTVAPEALGLLVEPMFPRTLYSMLAKGALEIGAVYTGKDGVTRLLYEPKSLPTVSKRGLGVCG